MRFVFIASISVEKNQAISLMDPSEYHYPTIQSNWVNSVCDWFEQEYQLMPSQEDVAACLYNWDP